MAAYFVSYALTTYGTGEIRPGWEEVPFDGPVTGETALRELGHRLANILIVKRIAAPRQRISILNWRRFEAPE